MALVSVIIPTFNSGERIADTLSSVFSQDMTDLEVIVVDDGSTDGTPERVSGLDERIRLVRQTNQGVAAARNAGLEHAKGRFIAFLDHDDIWHPQKLSAQLNALMGHPEAGCVISHYKRWDDTLVPEFDNPKLDGSFLDSSFQGWVYHLLVLDNELLGTALFRREVIEAVGAFDGSLPPSDDWDYLIRASRLSRFIKLAQVTTLYRIHRQQTSRQLDRLNVSAIFRERTIARYGKTGPDGSPVDMAAFRRYLYASHVGFGAGHLKHGCAGIAATAFFRALKCRPYEARTWLLLLISSARWTSRLLLEWGRRRAH